MISRCRFESSSLYRSHDSVVGTEIMLRAGRSGVRIQVRANGFPLLRNVHSDSGAHPSSYSLGAGDLSRGQCGRAVKLTTHLHLVPRLKISGVVQLLPPDAFMALTVKALRFFYLFPRGSCESSDFVTTASFRIPSNSLFTSGPTIRVYTI